MYVIGRRCGETYPEPQRAGGVSQQAAFAADQNADAWLHTEGDPNEIIATATITLQAGSSVRIDGNTTFLGGVATGRAFLFAGDNLGAMLIGLVSESFEVGQFGSLAYLGLLTGQSAGPLTVTLVVNQSSNAGATIASAGENVLMLTEILA